MTILKSPYDTTACRLYDTKKISHALSVAFLNGVADPVDGIAGIRRITSETNVSDDVPSFSHPFVATVANKEYVFMDSRGYGKLDASSREFTITNKVDYPIMVARAKLTYIWINENPFVLRDISQAPLAIYASWISEAIAFRYMLDPAEQIKLYILAGLFYISQFSNDVEVDERESLRITSNLIKTLRVSSDDVFTVLDKVKHVEDVHHFCALATEITGSARLANLNHGVLFTIIGNTWFGTNSKEMLAVAVEHPPTWIAILLAAFSERTFKDSQIFKISERRQYSDMGKDFLRVAIKVLDLADK